MVSTYVILLSSLYQRPRDGQRFRLAAIRQNDRRTAAFEQAHHGSAEANCLAGMTGGAFTADVRQKPAVAIVITGRRGDVGREHGGAPCFGKKRVVGKRRIPAFEIDDRTVDAAIALGGARLVLVGAHEDAVMQRIAPGAPGV